MPWSWSKMGHVSPTCHFPAGQETDIKKGRVQGAVKKGGDLARLKELRNETWLWEQSSAVSSGGIRLKEAKEGLDSRTGTC